MASSSVGSLIPLGQKPDKSSKKDDLTGGLISIGGKPKAAADDTLDDFDLDDLLNDTPKPSSKAPSSSPKKSRKSKDKARKKKKDKGNDLDDSTSPIKPSKSSFAFDDNEHDQASSRPAKPKTSMKNLDDEFAKALGFDESEFRSSATLDSPDKTPPSPVFQAPPPVPAPSPPLPADKGAISASFFDDIPDNQANMHSPSQSLVDSRPRGGRGGRRSSSNDQDTLDPFGAKETLKPTDPFAKPSVTPRHDPFGATTSATKQQDSTRPINQVESASDQSNEKTRLNLSVNPTSETDQVRSFPWMKPQDTATSAVVPSFPWMQAKRDHVADVVSPKFEDPPVKQTETKSDLPAFPWLKKKPAEVAISTTQLEAKIEPPSPIKTIDDMPAFPWTKNTPEAPDIPGQPPSSSLVVAEQLPPPVLAISKPDSPVRATLEIIPPDRSNDPSNAMTPPRHKDPSPRRPSPSPPKLSTSDLDIPPSLDLRNSPEKKPSNSSPKRASPSSRAAFLNDDSAIVPAFVTNQLAQSQEMVTCLTAQLNTANSTLTTLQAEHASVVATLGVETERNAALTVDVASLRQNELALQDDLARVQTESAQRLDQLTSALVDKQSLSQEAAALRVQTLELGPLQALVAELQLENAALRGQVSTAQASLAASQRELVQEKSMHAQSVERFQRVQHDREQEALLQQRWQADEQRHAEKDALERLLTQVRAAVSGLKVLQENVVGSKSESEMRIWGENETRARVLVDMEGTCKAFMHRSQEECHRLQALLNAMEGTMRTLRGDHMEEKERLRSEQSRLDELAGHFQAQTTLLQERTDTNTRVVTQTLSAYIQDIRVAEARLHTRREQLLDEERQLHFARAAFAAQQEEALRDQRVAQEKLHMEQKRVEDKLHRVRHETNAFETLVHAHADEMNALAAYQVQLEHEKERLQNAATRVEHMAQQVREASEHSAAMEAQAKEAMREAATLVSQVQEERSRVLKQAGQLDDRERRLHDEMRSFMDTTRRQRGGGASSGFPSRQRKEDEKVAPVRPVFNLPPPPPPARRPTTEKVSITALRGDPTGLSPRFREEMEAFWSNGNQVQVDDVRNRMLLSCNKSSGITLPKSTRATPRSAMASAFVL
ncbi:hypothetical protein H257_06827 [Aphanomyces astaci]|uniref:Fas-binding factor 1 n=1 Tax=Aphanomyces astaci TaxID=112090 RepID=W4GL06_APHAT|nr:hypothetical protein H257_06827 [Aphanomyces astaci]ETV79563.1 hypothetical protein H257_06827 [Aphanomyces astaci]|eukprot:XP_009830499.1 hypothetical protein H257_06827 [Aphanomyces astaci]